jgi:hypothetical protein
MIIVLILVSMEIDVMRIVPQFILIVQPAIEIKHVFLAKITNLMEIYAIYYAQIVMIKNAIKMGLALIKADVILINIMVKIVP